MMWLFVFGLLMGSFLNVVIYRWPRGLDWIWARSRCVHCSYELQWYELVPVASWVWLRGQCRRCKKSISWQYPGVELSNAGLWVGLGWLAEQEFMVSGIGILGWSGTDLVRWLGLLVVGSVFVVIWLIDWQQMLIPDGASVILLILGLLFGLIGEPSWWLRLAYGLGAGMFFASLYWLTKGRGMGLGDVKLAVGLGVLLAEMVVVGLVAAFVTGSVVGVVMMGLGKAKFGRPIPFGPFLLLGAVVAMMWGEQIVGWYLGISYL